MLIDSFGRTIDYLRVSVTDRCNLRCVYCMPEEGVEWKPHTDMLSFEETLHLCGILAGLGIRKIKITGGEPLVRKGTASFIAALRTIPDIEQITLTTNGLLLEEFLSVLNSSPAGRPPLEGINISLDTLDNGIFRRITRYEETEKKAAAACEGPARVFRGIESARAMGIPVKVNCVPLWGINEADLANVARLAENIDMAVRFIELMPLGCAGSLEPIPGAEVAKILEKAFGVLEPWQKRLGNGPAKYYRIDGFAGKIGFINAVSGGFCETCNRLRLTPEGLLKPCLSSDTALDLRALLRSGVSGRDIAGAVEELVSRKPRAHSFSGLYGNETGDHRKKEMFRIGG
jgi:cyclic pyranopterin phosphate synthase